MCNFCGLISSLKIPYLKIWRGRNGLKRRYLGTIGQRLKCSSMKGGCCLRRRGCWSVCCTSSSCLDSPRFLDTLKNWASTTVSVTVSKRIPAVSHLWYFTSDGFRLRHSSLQIFLAEQSLDLPVSRSFPVSLLVSVLETERLSCHQIKNPLSIQSLPKETESDPSWLALTFYFLTFMCQILFVFLDLCVLISCWMIG